MNQKISNTRNKVVIIDYGAGNTKSVQFAMERLGIDAILSDEVDTITQANKVIFPGVGEARSAMKMLKAKGLDQLIPNLKQPVLGICLGMQLMCEFTEEGQTEGLGIFKVDVEHFNGQLKVPQMGWNTITRLKSDLFKGVKEEEFMYLVHSYYAKECPQTIAITNYGIKYSSALQQANFYGVQFHPEKSSTAGEQVLRNFINM